MATIKPFIFKDGGNIIKLVDMSKIVGTTTGWDYGHTLYSERENLFHGRGAMEVSVTVQLGRMSSLNLQLCGEAAESFLAWCKLHNAADRKKELIEEIAQKSKELKEITDNE